MPAPRSAWIVPRATASAVRGATVMIAAAVIVVDVTATEAVVIVTAVAIVIALQRRPWSPRVTRPCRS